MASNLPPSQHTGAVLCTFMKVSVTGVVCRSYYCCLHECLMFQVCVLLIPTEVGPKCHSFFHLPYKLCNHFMSCFHNLSSSLAQDCDVTEGSECTFPWKNKQWLKVWSRAREQWAANWMDIDSWQTVQFRLLPPTLWQLWDTVVLNLQPLTHKWRTHTHILALSWCYKISMTMILKKLNKNQA